LEALGISVNGIIAYIINFVILVVLLRMFLYQPVKNMLAQRQQRIAEGLEAADRAAQEAAQQKAEFEKSLAKARQESQEGAKKAAEARARFPAAVRLMAQYLPSTSGAAGWLSRAWPTPRRPGRR
jgi:F-type H+-transporting ATPase subunit b